MKSKYQTMMKSSSHVLFYISTYRLTQSLSLSIISLFWLENSILIEILSRVFLLDPWDELRHENQVQLIRLDFTRFMPSLFLSIDDKSLIYCLPSTSTVWIVKEKWPVVNNIQVCFISVYQGRAVLLSISLDFFIKWCPIFKIYSLGLRVTGFFESHLRYSKCIRWWKGKMTSICPTKQNEMKMRKAEENGWRHFSTFSLT